MDAVMAQKTVDFIFNATGRYAIICGVDGVIIAAKASHRVGSIHPGAQAMLRDRLAEAMVSLEQEAASGGTMLAGCNLPIWYNEELIGSIGIGGDPERTEPVTRMASGLIAKELREREMLDRLLDHAAQMAQSITAISTNVAQADQAQIKVAAEVDEVEHLIAASFQDIQKTDEVISTIQAIANNTQMLGLNASIEAAHAREFGRGFSIVAESVRKLSIQCGEAAESVKATQTHLHSSMSQVVQFSQHLMANTHQQTRATSEISSMVAGLKTVSEALMAMTQA